MGLNFTLNNTENEETLYDVIVIGGGPAGASAAIYTARAGLRTLVLDKSITAGALGTTEKISNYPGIPGPVTGEEIVRIIREQAKSFGAEFIQDKIVGSFLEGEIKTIMGGTGSYRGRTVVITTGAMGRTKQLPGEERLLGRGVSSCATCDAAFFKELPVAVIGMNDEAFEEALYLTRFASEVYLITPGKKFTANEDLMNIAEANEKIQLMPRTRIGEIIGEQKVEGLQIKPRGGDETTLPVNGVFIYTQGNHPILDYIGDAIEKGENGCLLVDKNNQTNIPGVFAGGDLLCEHIQQAVIAAADGVNAAINIDRYLNKRQTAHADWKH